MSTIAISKKKMKWPSPAVQKKVELNPKKENSKAAVKEEKNTKTIASVPPAPKAPAIAEPKIAPATPTIPIPTPVSIEKLEEKKAVEERRIDQPVMPERIMMPKQLEGAELKKEIESLLFSSGKMMTEKELAELTNNTPKAVRKTLEELKADYDARDTSLVLVQANESWKLNVRERYIHLVTKIVADTELPFPVLETLSIIAFKAPIVQAEVIRMRGTNAYEHIGVLMEGGFVEKRKKGRSFELGLTPKCYEYFDVQGDRSLKEALKDAKPKEKKLTKLGNLPVVDLPEEAKRIEEEGKPGAEKKMLGDFEVVDTPEGEAGSSVSDAGEDVKPAKEMFKPDNDFLKKIDDQINMLSKKNDDNDQDELFRKKEVAEEEVPAAEGAGSDEEPASTGSQKSNDIFGKHREDKSRSAEDAYPDDDNDKDKDDEEEKEKP
ncbi:MAG: SMC-Scp complex subunit ScpB [archaeon]